jgi:hypothetical protein
MQTETRIGDADADAEQMQLISPVNAGRKEGMIGVVAVVLTSIGHERRCED